MQKPLYTENESAVNVKKIRCQQLLSTSALRRNATCGKSGRNLFLITLLKACWKTNYTMFTGIPFIHTLIDSHSNSVVHDFPLRKPCWLFPNRLCLFTFSKVSLLDSLPFHQTRKSSSACSFPQSPFCEKAETGVFPGRIAACQSSRSSSVGAVGNSRVEALASRSAISHLSFSPVNATWPGDLLAANTPTWSNTFCIFTQTHLVQLTPTLYSRKNSSGVETSPVSPTAKSNERN